MTQQSRPKFVAHSPLAPVTAYPIRMSALGPGCVKTCTSRECAELFSLFSSFDGDCQSGSFLIQRNRDKLSTREFDVGVFTQPGSRADLSARQLDVCFAPMSRHHRWWLPCPFGAKPGSRRFIRSPRWHLRSIRQLFRGQAPLPSVRGGRDGKGPQSHQQQFPRFCEHLFDYRSTAICE
jgi:hypothetical protein